MRAFQIAFGLVFSQALCPTLISIAGIAYLTKICLFGFQTALFNGVAV
ncbi:hypothetical protein ACTHS3_07530 [Neisseria sp. P0009.S007]